jgi:hypothetical protein
MLVLEVTGPSEALSAVREEIERAASSLPSGIELNRARALAGRDRLWKQVDFATRAINLGWWDMIGGDVLLGEFERAAIRRLAVGDVQAAALGLCSAREVVQSVEGAETVGSAAAGIAGPTQAQWHSVLQPLAEARSTDAFEVQELRPGLRVALVRVPGQEQAAIVTTIRVAGRQEPAMSALMAVGSELHTVDEIRDYLTYHASEIYPSAGGQVSIGAGVKARGLTEYGLIALGPSEYAAQLMELQAELLRRPQTSEQACARAAELRHKHAELLQAASRAGEIGAYVPDGFIGVALSPEYPETAREVHDALNALQHIEQVEIIAIGDFSRALLVSAIEAAWAGGGERGD